MTDADHIKTIRLFDLSKAQSSGADFPLADWEAEHLPQCAECQRVVAVFARQFRQQPPLSTPRQNATSPRFNVGDQVRVTAPGIHMSKRGVVMDVIAPTAGDFVYRYRVRFLDGSSGTFFGFELE